MKFKSHSLLFIVFSTFSFLLTFCNAQNESPAQLDVQLELESIVNKLGLDSNEIARLYPAIVDGRIGEVAALLEEHADVNAKNKNVKPCVSKEIATLHSAVDVYGDNIKQVSILLKMGADVNAKDKDGKTPLHLAAKLKHPTMIKLLLEKGANINEQDNNGDTPLHEVSALYDQSAFAAKSANLLIKAGADIEAKNKTGSTPLINAMEQCERSSSSRIPMAVAKTLIEHGANVNAKDNHGKTPLHFKVYAIEMTKMLINKGANVNAKTNDRETPLHSTRWIDIAKILIENGADINAKTNDGYTPLYTTDVLDIAKMLISMGANVKERTKDGKTPLHCTRDTRIAEILIANGADINAKTNDGETPLLSTDRTEIAKILINMGAKIPTINGAGSIKVKDLIESYWLQGDMLMGVLKIVRALVLKGTYINKKDCYSETPLYTASKIGGDIGVELVKHLIKAGANINAKSETICSDECEFTPLLVSLAQEIGKGNAKTATFLIENGANVNVETNDGSTPLYFAVLHSDIKLVSLLLSKGANVNKKNTKGMTPLHMAAMLGHVKIMKILLKNKATVDAKDNKGITPLFLVLLTLITQELSNAEDVIKLLKENGADANPVTLRGETPQEYYEKYLKLPMFIQENFYACC